MRRALKRILDESSAPLERFLFHWLGALWCNRGIGGVWRTSVIVEAIKLLELRLVYFVMGSKTPSHVAPIRQCCDCSKMVQRGHSHVQESCPFPQKWCPKSGKGLVGDRWTSTQMTNRVIVDYNFPWLRWIVHVVRADWLMSDLTVFCLCFWLYCWFWLHFTQSCFWP